MADDPHAPGERQAAARHLLDRPLVCQEDDTDTFTLIRRHEADLDRWFTQRLGYRLHVDADTARLFKTGGCRGDRRLSTPDRPLNQREHVVLALVLASLASGPSVISLRDLVAGVRSAAVDAEVDYGTEAADRRALVVALRWMLGVRLVAELHARVEEYANDEDADAVLRTRPDRIALLVMPALAGADTVEELLGRAERRDVTREWLRQRLTEDPVLYRTDVSDDEWSELRRRLGEETRLLDEMFGLRLEARAEGIAAIDPAGTLSSTRFPTTGSIGRAALVVLDLILQGEADPVTRFADILRDRPRGWSKQALEAPERMARHAIDLLVDTRLATRDGDSVKPLPAASRFRPDVTDSEGQQTLW